MLGNKRAYRDARRLRKRQTPSEILLWDRLRNRKLEGHKFCRQVPVGPYVADFCCREKRLIVEVDGGIHLKQKEYDQEREAILKQTGFRVVRCSNDEVQQDMQKVIERILSAL